MLNRTWEDGMNKTPGIALGLGLAAGAILAGA
jgi:hypothetical protein